MENILIKSIAQMKNLNTTRKKWNKYAKENNLLTTYSIMWLTQKDYKDILKD